MAARLQLLGPEVVPRPVRKLHDTLGDRPRLGWLKRGRHQEFIAKAIGVLETVCPGVFLVQQHRWAFDGQAA